MIKFDITICKTGNAGYLGQSRDLVINAIKKEVSDKVYRDGGITWTKNGKQYHVEDIPKYSKEQLEQIYKSGNIYKGSKKPKYGYVRELTITEED